MGPNRTYNEQHNLTWTLPVDSEFKYMVRLHFCDFQDPVDAPGERQFGIFINSQTAEVFADVIMWTGHGKVPIYKDYILMVSNKEKENKQNITIDLHPRDAKYYDAILNGIEVFKVNNSDGNLAGLNPELLVAPQTPHGSSTSAGGKSKMKMKLIAADAVKENKGISKNQYGGSNKEHPLLSDDVEMECLMDSEASKRVFELSASTFSDSKHPVVRALLDPRQAAACDRKSGKTCLPKSNPGTKVPPNCSPGSLSRDCHHS
ncbi:hypothetical protein PTKIN_Ptkin15bG0176500 [Pterospermum kingtungense]